ncbi:hypothetical protein HZH66_014771 [Vespula vulgaris]|uniref:Phosphatidylinositol-glycan biosynthesis class X protein n=1 Tax=Vespula vulgaris TaxID=7454 RepID=A0A834MNM8_VESVU|nr:hypothetical protein HZH66_014771 [Vespula vulgaris]
MLMARRKISTANEKEFRSFRTMEITGVRVGETESKIISGSAGDKPGQLSGEISAGIKLHVDGSGFHRNFTYHIKLNNFTTNNCYISLHFVLPSALYVNINELADLRRVDKINVCSVGEKNIELFMENANSQNITFCSLINNGTCIASLPIHQRYQYPKENGDYENIILKKPILLIGCKQRIKEYRVSKIDLCPLCANMMIKWREIPYVIDEIDYIWTVPIGNTSFLPCVTCITLLTTIIGTVFLMGTIWKTMSKEHLKKN